MIVEPQCDEDIVVEVPCGEPEVYVEDTKTISCELRLGHSGSHVADAPTDKPAKLVWGEP